MNRRFRIFAEAFGRVLDYFSVAAVNSSQSRVIRDNDSDFLRCYRLLEDFNFSLFKGVLSAEICFVGVWSDC